jgi:hypothetical protein
MSLVDMIVTASDPEALGHPMMVPVEGNVSE